ncbi:L-threo-3-deoxy-hexylosonate aldolase [Escovopsis weberi]|uniref:L-threo-3-deoxy-hexylosonate aldolase n=1 Tax=Escovopsis weberi TaxID=150374 RepID=A0A0M8N1N5_ESCWE|nr:L-threo-3-deoxy-hexylosonate aldolase [Escovopsis weberi]
MATRRTLPCGIYAPTTTFFHAETEDLDIPTIKKHAVFLAEAGLAGIVVMGSNGEAAHCTREEKLAALRATREALDAAGFGSMPVIFGASEGSVRGTVELCKLAAVEGADYAMILPPSYYRTQVDDEVVYEYFAAVADASPLPVTLYNYPGAVAGVDMNSDLIVRISAHPNVVGTKFTCGSTGKLTRVAAACRAKTPLAEGSGYMAFGGMCDFTLQTLVSGGSGIIAGAANVVPKICVRVWNLWVEGKREEAQRLQAVVSRADWVLSKNLVASTKQGLQCAYGYGGTGRRPLKAMSEAGVRGIEEGLKEAMEIERSL